MSAIRLTATEREQLYRGVGARSRAIIDRALAMGITITRGETGVFRFRSGWCDIKVVRPSAIQPHELDPRR